METQFLNKIEDIKTWLKDMSITDYVINDNLTVDVNQDILLHNKNLTHLPIQFGIVKGTMDITKNKLTSLKGSPYEIEKDFACYNNLLTKLDFCLKVIGGYFRFSHNPIEKFYSLDIDCKGMIYMSKVKGMEYFDDYEVVGKYTTMLHIPFDDFQELLNTHALKEHLENTLNAHKENKVLKI